MEKQREGLFLKTSMLSAHLEMLISPIQEQNKPKTLKYNLKKLITIESVTLDTFFQKKTFSHMGLLK